MSRTIQQVLMDYINKGFQPFKPLQDALVKLERFEMQAGEKVQLVFESEKGVEFPYTKRVKDTELWLYENFGEPDDADNIQTIVTESYEDTDTVVSEETEEETNEASTYENNISGLRSYLFDTIWRLDNKEIEIERAKAVASVAQTILNSAKLEIEYRKYTDSKKKIELFEH